MVNKDFHIKILVKIQRSCRIAAQPAKGV